VIMNNIYIQLAKELGNSNELTLATLIMKGGSTPQIPGASALFNKKGLVAGTIGGGLIEAKVQDIAVTSTEVKQNKLLSYSLNTNFDEKEGAICGGAATVLLDVNPQENRNIFVQIKQSLEQNKSGVLITKIDKGSDGKILVRRYWFKNLKDFSIKFKKEFSLDYSDLSKRLETREPFLIENKSDRLITELTETSLFFEPIFPNPELVVVGAGHIGQALCHLGSLIDFNVSVIDDRPELANQERFPDANKIIVDKIEKAFAQIKITENTFIVIVTRGHHDDSLALKCCVKSDAAYIGMIGSKRKINLVREKFIHLGWATENEFDRIFAPIGLDIQSQTVQEIAVSIAAQLIQVKQEIKKGLNIPSIGCIVLAAGESTRMKQQKLLMPYKERTIIETVVDKCLQSKIDEIYIVVGSDSEKIKSKLAGLNLNIITNDNYKMGMLSSVQKGIDALPKSLKAVIILLGDQPMVKSEIIDLMIDSFHRSRKGIVIPTFAGKRGHPILIDLKYRKAVNFLNPGKGLRELIYNNQENIFEVEVETNEILRDIDTFEDYKNEIN